MLKPLTVPPRGACGEIGATASWQLHGQHPAERPVLTVAQVFKLAELVGRRPVGNIRQLLGGGYRLLFQRNGVMRTAPEVHPTRAVDDRARMGSERHARPLISAAEGPENQNFIGSPPVSPYGLHAVVFVSGLDRTSVPSSAAEKRAAMPTIRVDGTLLYYEEQGAGPSVILLHGSWSDHGTWAAVVGPLASQFRAVTYDRRGHSRSERSSEQGSLSRTRPT